MIASAEVRFLKRRAKNYGYHLDKEVPLPAPAIVIENVFNTSFQKHALLSYIVYPFLGQIQNDHSNHRECYTIAEILSELGYNVDVINWDHNSFVPVHQYEIVIDTHNNLARLSGYFSGNVKKILHAANAHWLFQNWTEYGRYHQFFLKTGVAITPPRLIPPGNSSQYCDVISMFGNEFTKSTYGKYGSKVYHLPMSVSTTPEIITERDYALAKNNFLWINSHGVLLKGLDIVIDAFKMLPQLNLYICGDMEKDSEFMNCIQPELSLAPNINFTGWVDTGSTAFRTLTAACAWVVGTSFSEGGGGSTLNCMAKGLIPVVSRTSSLTLPGDTGFYLEQNDATALAALLSRLVLLPDAELKERSFNAYHFVASGHTIENFKENYKAFLIKMLA